MCRSSKFVCNFHKPAGIIPTASWLVKKRGKAKEHIIFRIRSISAHVIPYKLKYFAQVIAETSRDVYGYILFLPNRDNKPKGQKYCIASPYIIQCFQIAE